MQITWVCCSVRESPCGVCSVIEMSLSLPAFINKWGYFNTTLVKFAAAKAALNGRGKPASSAATLDGCRIFTLVHSRRNGNFLLTPSTWPCSSLAWEAHGKGVEQTDLSLQGESTFALFSCSSAKCFASPSGRSQERVPLLAPTGNVGGSVGGWGSQRNKQRPY